MGSNDDTPSLAHALHKAFILSASKPFLGYPNRQVKKSNETSIQYDWLTYEEVFQKVLHLSDSLRQISLLQRSVVGICADNCVEWIVTDFSCTFNDYISVGLHSSWSEECMLNVLRSAETDCIVCMSCDLYKFLKASTLCLCIQHIIVIDDTNMNSNKDAFSTADAQIIKKFEEDNRESTVKVHLFNSFLSNKKSVSTETERATYDTTNYIGNDELRTITGAGGMMPCWFGLHYPIPIGESDEIYTLMYTSGTTGNPKGVAVTKNRWLLDAKSNLFLGQSEPTVVSYMSLAHGGDRGICWQACFAGAKIGLISPVTHNAIELLNNIQSIKPTFLLCMSYLWCEYFSLFKKDLEEKVVSYIIENEFYHLYLTCTSRYIFILIFVVTHRSSTVSRNSFALIDFKLLK